MADPLTAGIAAAASGAAALFSYNKDAFVFEKTLHQAEAHQRQSMRVQEVALYREDIRDLFGVTVQKMDNYLIVNTLMIGFCISLLYAIDLPDWTPDWVFWMWTLSMSGAMLFLLLSIWLCLHASITAQSLVVRLLTQWLRLPVPNSKEISKYAHKFLDYEKNASNLLRVPMFAQIFNKQKSVPIPEEPPLLYPLPGPLGHAGNKGGVFRGIEDLTSPQLQKTHLHLFRQLARSWRGYDAYARVCMIMGTNQLLQALGHLSVAKMFLAQQQPVASLFVVITMHSLSLLHFKLNITPTRKQHTMMTFLLGVPPVMTFVAASLFFYNLGKAADITAIFAIFIHLVWICFVLTLAVEDDGGMPRNFTTVGLSSDIVGDDTFQDYIDDELERIRQREPEESAVSHMEEDPIMLVKRRVRKLVRQWDNVTQGTLVLTELEEKNRKLKIAKRFDKLSEYVRNLPVGDIRVGEEEELRVLLDVKWNRLNSQDVFINIDTGEIRVPSAAAATTDPLATRTSVAPVQSKLERFVSEIKRFKETGITAEVEGEDASGSSSSATDSNLTSGVTATGLSNKTERADSETNLSESTSLLFDDSKHTNKMLEKQSTRPWSSYKQGSGLLIICWFIALIMAILLPCGVTLRPAVPPGVMRAGGNHGAHMGAHGAIGPAHHAIAAAGRIR